MAQKGLKMVVLGHTDARVALLTWVGSHLSTTTREGLQHVTRFKTAAACIAAVMAVSAGAYAAPTAHDGTHRLGSARLARPAHHRWSTRVQTKPDALTHALRNDRLTRAQYALQRARSLFHLKQVRGRYGNVARPDPRSATMILRDLFAHYRQLSGPDRARADILLARPDDGSNDPGGDGYQNGVQVQAACTTNFCFHWVTTTADAVPNGDSDADGVPDQVETTAAVFEHVHDVEVTQMHFKAPKSDQTSSNNGGDGRTDIYLADVGGDHIFGFCTSDDPNIDKLGTTQYSFYDVSAYCVVDNDFTPSQFPGTSGLEALEVTAAHEHFHAVQFAYDALEDNWLMEGSAVWIEDVVYDDVNDYYQYLPVSQMGLPGVPLDYSTPSSDETVAGQSKYGAFLFFRFIEDWVLLHDDGTPDTSFMQEIWLRADSTRGSDSDLYSLAAVKATLAARQADFASVYTLFGTANLFPSSFYEEGAAYGQLTGPRVTRAKLTASTPAKILRGTLDHLTQGYADFIPGTGARPSSKLRLAIDAPLPGRGAAATLVTVRTDGTGDYSLVSLNSAGDKTIKVPFGKGRISHVILIVTNGSTALTCNQGFFFSCRGKPTYDNQKFAVGGRLLR